MIYYTYSKLNPLGLAYFMLLLLFLCQKPIACQFVRLQLTGRSLCVRNWSQMIHCEHWTTDLQPTVYSRAKPTYVYVYPKPKPKN